MRISSPKSSVSSLLTILWQYQMAWSNMGDSTAFGMDVCYHAIGVTALLQRICYSTVNTLERI